MIHRKEVLDKSDIILRDGLYWLECPICGKDHGSSDERDLTPVLAVCYGNPSHEDWKQYKKERNLKNADIADIIGMTSDSVRNQVQPSKQLPKWAISMLYEWKQ